MMGSFDTQRQYQVAQVLQSLLLVLGVALLGVGAGYYLSLAAVGDTVCAAAFAAPDGCSPLVADLNDGLVWSLGIGAFAIAAAGGMGYLLRRAEL